MTTINDVAEAKALAAGTIDKIVRLRRQGRKVRAGHAG